LALTVLKYREIFRHLLPPKPHKLLSRSHFPPSRFKAKNQRPQIIHPAIPPRRQNLDTLPLPKILPPPTKPGLPATLRGPSNSNQTPSKAKENPQQNPENPEIFRRSLEMGGNFGS
jgi:hypothetical protein